jgi:hypothetical protein
MEEWYYVIFCISSLAEECPSSKLHAARRQLPVAEQFASYGLGALFPQ